MHRTKSNHWPQFQDKELVKYMPNPIKRSSLPVARFGASSTVPSVSISENGQLRLNVIASKTFAGLPLMLVGDFDEKTRVITFKAVAEPPKGWELGDCFPLNAGKKQGSGSYLSCAPLWRQIGYDFKTSGNQNVNDLTFNEEKKTLSFKVPKGALEARVKAVRTKKAKPVAAAAASMAPAGGDSLDI